MLRRPGGWIVFGLVLLATSAHRTEGCGFRHSGSSGIESTSGRGTRADGAIEAPVIRVVDGDTIRVRLKSGEERVRYIGMDTPELAHPRWGEQPFAREASEANRRLVEGRTVYLRLDVQERDKYGRVLAYVYLPDGTFVNAALVEQGFARVMTIPPNVQHAELLRRLQQEAREAGRGMWADEAGESGMP